MNRDSVAGLGIGLLVGAVAGLAVGILFAPKPGSETRQMIRERAVDVANRAKDRLNRIRGRAGEAQDEITEEA
jgi:gas vesicle protein